jgi:hypothetical protein
MKFGVWSRKANGRLMAVYIANFGRGNYAWEDCKRRSTIATMNHERSHPFWLADDREGYIDICQRHDRTAEGKPVPVNLASRWFNLMTIISQSANDLWLHKSGDDIWWTYSMDEPAKIDDIPRKLDFQDERVFECHKPCQTWSKQDKHGRTISWQSLHPRAKDFLTTESTLQKLSDDNSSFALALIEGVDLSPWTGRSDWKRALSSARVPPVHNAGASSKSISSMAFQAEDTASNSNGQMESRKIKNKDFRFKDRLNLERYLKQLLAKQSGLCAISGLVLQYQGTETDKKMLCSLDRIDSDGHYEAGNLQIVCRFINFWKSDETDAEFRRLLTILRGS